MNDAFTTRQIAELLSVEEWQVRRLFESGRIAEPMKFGGKRVIKSDLLPTIVDGLRERGWLKGDTEVATL